MVMSEHGLTFRICPLDHKWLHDFQLHCMLPVAEIVATPVEPAYPDILKIDGKIRDFDVPTSLRMIDHDGRAPVHPRALQQAMIACTRETGKFIAFSDNANGPFFPIFGYGSRACLQRCCICIGNISFVR